MKKILLIAACGLLLHGAASAVQAVKAKRSTYRDEVYGFSLETPRFAAREANGRSIPLMVFGPAKNNFSDNLNVMVMDKAGGREKYRGLNSAELAQKGFKVVEDKDATVSGRDAIVLEYTGRIQGRDMHFLSLGVLDKEQTYLFTYTASEDTYKNVAAEFRASLESIKINDAP